MIETIPDEKGVAPDTWFDAKSYYLKSPERVKQAIQKLLTNGDGNGHRLSGYDWRLIRQFRAQYKV